MTQLKFLQYGLSCADVGDQVSVSAATSCPWVMSAQAGLCYLCLYLCWPLLPALTPDQARPGGRRSILCCVHLFDFSSFLDALASLKPHYWSKFTHFFRYITNVFQMCTFQIFFKSFTNMLVLIPPVMSNVK